MLKLYRWPDNDWKSIGAELPGEIIWIDLINPSDEEKQFVESRLKIRVPSEHSLSEIEASSRLIFDHGTLYLSSPAVRLDEYKEAHLTSVGFVIGPQVLVTVRFSPLLPFDVVAKQMQADGDPKDSGLHNGMCVFTSILEAMVDRGADAMEHLGATADELSRAVFKGGLVRSKRPVRSSLTVSAGVSMRRRSGSSMRPRILLRHHRSSPRGSFGTSHNNSHRWLRLTGCGLSAR